MHPAHASASHTSHTRQGSVTDGRAARWQRRLCTTTTGAARGGLSQTSIPRSPRRPMSLLRAQRLSADHGGHAGRAAALPAARTRGERSVCTHPLLVRARAASAPDGSQEVSSASTVGSPAARASGTRSVLVTRAVAAPRGGCGGMCQQWRWLHASWTAEDAAAPWTDGPLPEVVGRLLWSNEDRSQKSGHVKHCS